jgi:hypothetical protein
MKIELDLPEIEGYEYTGKNRQAKGEHYLTNANRVGFQPTPLGYTIGHYPILKKKAPKYKVLDSVAFDGVYVEIKALEDAIEIIGSHYNWSADLRAATLELKELLN